MPTTVPAGALPMPLFPHRSRRQPAGPLLAPRLETLALALGCAGPLALLAGLAPASAQQAGYGQTMGTTPVETQMYNYDPANGSRTGSSSGGINPANPLDLINKIRKGQAMDDATPPATAIDQALKALEAQTASPSARPMSPVVASPRPAAGAGATP